ncbi:MAG: hypothetical protein RL342_2228 [Pseudomonadota bacterium]
MTLFAGVFNVGAPREVPLGLMEDLTRHLCRAPLCDAAGLALGSRQTHHSAGFYMTHWDSGAFGEAAWREAADGSVSTLVGDPLLTEHNTRLSRSQQLDQLAPVGQRLEVAPLARCRGTFACVHFDAPSHCLQLAADALGLRPVYYVLQDDWLIFSSVLRVLEAAQDVNKTLSLLGMAELSAFTYPLADRTPYEGIKRLREGELLGASRAGVSLESTIDWLNPGKSADTPQAAAAQIYAAFDEAVCARAGTDQTVYSFLSGGMDSRAIVANLLSSGREVVAMNFSGEASQDLHYAQQFADLAGPGCHLHCLPGGHFPNFSLLALSAKTTLEQAAPTGVDRPRLLWSGDGGSVGLGHVYLDEPLLDLAEQGGVEEAVDYFLSLNRIGLSTGILSAATRHQLPQMLFDSVVHEVNRYPCQDMGRRFYLFLLFNDQRRHLHQHFESIDQHGLELLTPFFDTRFLQAVAATPARWGVLHHLYGHFFAQLPTFARQTPWQTYPGHEACPVKGADAGGAGHYQWSQTPIRHGWLARLRCAWQLVDSARARAQPPVFSRPRIWLAALGHALGLQDSRYILTRLKLYQYHLAQTQSR